MYRVNIKGVSQCWLTEAEMMMMMMMSVSKGDCATVGLQKIKGDFTIK